MLSLTQNRFITGIAILSMLCAFSQRVSAATVGDVLVKYGVTVKDTQDEIELMLGEAQQDYIDTYNNFVKGLDSNLVKELANELLSERALAYDVGQLAMRLDYCKLYIDTLVQDNYSLELILEAEEDYIETQKQLVDAVEQQEILKDRRNSLSYYDELVEKASTIEDVRTKEYVVKKLRYELSTAKNYGMIGDLRPANPTSAQFHINSPFGYRVNPFDSSKREFHNGLDLKGTPADTVYALYGGKVIYAGIKGGFGNMVIVDHGEGLSSLYGHMSSISVNVGDYAAQGSVLGFVGSTGRSTGPHLHLGVYINGQPRDPNVLFR